MNGSCETSKCGTKSWIIGTLVAFAVTMGFDWFVHGNLLMDTYKATAEMWRPEAEMQKFFPFCIAKHVIEAAIFVALYGCWRSKTSCGAIGSKDCPGKKSMGFGLMIGLLLGVSSASSYIYMDIPQSLALSWLAAETAKWSITGMVLGLLSAKCMKTSA